VKPQGLFAALHAVETRLLMIAEKHAKTKRKTRIERIFYVPSKLKK